LFWTQEGTAQTPSLSPPGKLKIAIDCQSGPALAGAAPNARPRGGAPLSSGVITSLCSDNQAMIFLMKIF